MPDLAAFHPQIVHFVIAFLILGVVARVLSLLPLGDRFKFVGPMATVLLILGTLAAIAAFKSGMDAHGQVERVPGARNAVTEHEEWGTRTRNVFGAIAVLELAALAMMSRRRLAQGLRVVSALAGLGGLFVLYEASEHGGELVYSYAGGVGIRTGAQILQEEIVRRVAKNVMNEKGKKISYLVGTMIELPRAALTADEIAHRAEFFNYGTNDLTQTTFGLSRDDAGKFLPLYVQNEILPSVPFEALDQTGVGQLVEMGTRKGRSVRKDLKVGICSKHGGEPSSVEFCHRTGLNYVSCSPFRVPIARLAAARAVINEKKLKKSASKKKK